MSIRDRIRSHADSTKVEAKPRRDPRRAVSLPGFAMLADGTTIGINVFNLSYDGCGIHAPAPLASGMRLKMSVLGIAGSLQGTVSWCEDEHAGVRFDC